MLVHVHEASPVAPIISSMYIDEIQDVVQRLVINRLANCIALIYTKCIYFVWLLPPQAIKRWDYVLGSMVIIKLIWRRSSKGCGCITEPPVKLIEGALHN